MTTRRTIAILAASLCVAGLLTLVPDFSQTSHAAQAPAEGAPAPAPSGPVKTLLVTGGPIHDGKGIGDLVEETMKKSGLFDVTRAHEDLDAFLADRIAPFDLVVFYYTLGELKEAQKRGLMNHIAAGTNGGGTSLIGIRIGFIAVIAGKPPLSQTGAEAPDLRWPGLR